MTVAPVLRDAWRALRASPLVTGIAVLSLALGIGANTAMFSIVNSLLLRSLPVRDPQRLAVLQSGEDRFSSWTNPIWEQLRAHGDLFGGVTAYSTTRFDLAQSGQTQFVEGMWVSGSFLDVLGVQPILGRGFSADDDRRGGGKDGPTTIISYNFWQRHFGGAEDAVGRTLTIERVPFTIIGVTPPDFFGTEVGRRFDVLVPIGTEPVIRGRESGLDKRSMWWLDILIRLAPGQSFDEATAKLRAIQPQIRQATIPEHYRPQDVKRYLAEGFWAKPASGGVSMLRTRYQKPLSTLLVVVGLVLLIACANIANLLLARASARRHEMSLRLALGASRAQLVRQLLAESALMSVGGAALGVIFAQWGSRLLVRQLSTSRSPVFLDLSLDWRVLAFTAAVAIGTAILFGTVPALRATRVEPHEALKEQGRGIAGERGFGFGSMLVAAQVALSLVLIVAAGLFVRTFTRLAHLDIGFDRDRVLVVSVDAERDSIKPEQRADLYMRLWRAVSSVPGVTHAGASAVTPVSGSSWQFGVEVVGGPQLSERERSVFANMISPGWFATYGTTLKAGRDFTMADRAGAPGVAIVNEAFVRKLVGSPNALGRVIRLGGFGPRPARDLQIVGIAEDAVYRSLRDPAPPTMYLPITQEADPMPFIQVSVRAASGSPALLTKSVAARLLQENPGLALTFRPLAEQVNAALTQERIVAMLSGFFGALALLLAGLGLYGVTSYAVGRRRAEIGIRLALGSDRMDIMRLVLGRVALLVGVGLVAGGTLSLWAGRFVKTLLYGLEPRDPQTFVGAAAILVIVGAIAGVIPARRAAGMDPAKVLREG
jgi:predicted permease